MYKCSKCNMAVIVLPNGPPVRACNCDASIVVDMGAGMVVHGGLKL